MAGETRATSKRATVRFRLLCQLAFCCFAISAPSFGQGTAFVCENNGLTRSVEIVSEPDLRSPREAYHYLRRIHQIVTYLGICDGNMEEGSLRCDANVSVMLNGAITYGKKDRNRHSNDSHRHLR